MASLAQHPEQVIASRPAKRIAWPDLAIILIAFVIQIPLVLNADLGWLLTVCEKMLGGARLGKDIFELNPPLSVLIYMPAAYLGTILPIPAHIFVIIMVLLGAWGVTQLTLVVLSASDWDEAVRRRASLSLLMVLTLVPGGTFAQREHVAVLAMVPFVALAASQSLTSANGTPSWIRLATGLAAALAMCLKPHYALLAAPPVIWAAYRRRSLRPLFGLECWAAGILVVAYYISVLVAFPSYTSLESRWNAAAYLSLRMAARYFVNSAVLSTAAGLAFMLHLTCGRSRSNWTVAAPWLLAACGGYLSYVSQGKGFVYMRLPTVSFGLLAVLLTPAFLGRPLWQRINAMVMLASLPAIAWLITTSDEPAGLQSLVEAAAPARPKLLVIGSRAGTGEPLVRRLHGEWASATASQLGAAVAQFRLDEGLSAEDRLVAMQMIALDRARVRDNLQRRQPDVLLVDSVSMGRPFDWQAWLRADPAINRELVCNYRLAGRRGPVEVWVRQPARNV